MDIEMKRKLLNIHLKYVDRYIDKLIYCNARNFPTQWAYNLLLNELRTELKMTTLDFGDMPKWLNKEMKENEN